MANGPTPDQIAQVQANLKNMQAFNDYVYNQGQSRVLNAYFLLGQQDNNDPGTVVGLNLMEGVFWGVGSELGPIGNFMASFLSGMLSWWTNNTPPSLNTTFANLLIRLQNTSAAIDTQLAAYYEDVADNWNVQFTYNGQTQALSDLANITIPPETDTQFETLANAALFALDQQVWQTVLRANFVVTLWQANDPPMSGDPSQPPVQWDEAFIAAHPAYYNTWTWHNSQGCGDTSGWDVSEYNLGTGAGPLSDGSISPSACQYLFIDSSDGVVINGNGLFARATVFSGLGIPQTSYTPPYSGAGATQDKLSRAYLRAMKEGRTLGVLVQREGREHVERLVIERARRDSVFARDLVCRPRETLQEFLGVLIPEVVSVGVIFENPRAFALVIPMEVGALTAGQGT